MDIDRYKKKKKKILVEYTFANSYPLGLPALMGPGGCGPPPGKLPAGPYPLSGPAGAGSTTALASLRYLVLSLDAISARASFATPKFPDI